MTTNTATGRPRNGNRRDFVLPVRLRRATAKRDQRTVARPRFGSFATLAAIRRAPSLVSSLAADRRPTADRWCRQRHRATVMIDYSHGGYRHCTTGRGEGSADGAGCREGTGSADGTGCREGTGSAASTGRRECTATTPNVQQWLGPNQIRCALGNLARASLSVMQAGEALASGGPIMVATARIGIMRIVIAKATSTFIEMNTGSSRYSPRSVSPHPARTLTVANLSRGQF
jgi:hypothetical protein